MTSAAAVAAAYQEHLTPQDRAIVARAVERGGSPGHRGPTAELDPALLLDLLASDAVAAAVLGPAAQVQGPADRAQGSVGGVPGPADGGPGPDRPTVVVVGPTGAGAWPGTGAWSDAGTWSGAGAWPADPEAARRGLELASASPFLVFAVAVHRLAADLRHAGHVDEFAGPRRRLVVLGTADLVEVLDDPWRRLYLVELLTSFTKVASGSVWVRTGRRVRRLRISDLDPVRLAGLLGVLPEEQHAGVYRRLGDLALFLTGVFPDHTATQGLAQVAEQRLRRTTGHLGPTAPPSPNAPPSPDALLGTEGAVGLLEELGRRWYRLAVHSVRGPLTGTASALPALAARFGPARRTLNVLTDRYLLPRRHDLFGRAP